MKVYFRKEIFTNAFYIGGSAAPFEHVGNNQGVLELDSDKDGETISALNKAASEQRGGIVKINEAEFVEKKNSGLSTQSPRRVRQHETLRVMQSPFQKKPPEPAKPAEATPPPPPASVSPAKQMEDTLSALRQADEPSKPATDPELPAFKPATGKAKKPAEQPAPA